MKSILEFAKAKLAKRKISMITSYDSWTAKIIAASPIDCILVGDSCMMTTHGQRDTTRASVEIMALHIAAVRAGAPEKFVIGDMPFLAHRIAREKTMLAVRQLIQSGANAVKIEGSDFDEIKYIVDSGVPVMGHLGLTPQSINSLGGYKVQATTLDAQERLVTAARGLQDAGVFALVLECVPSSLAERVTNTLDIPVIGIGAGLSCDGQVLVLNDLIGADPDFQPKFVRRYANVNEIIGSALKQFSADVRDGLFPAEAESFQGSAPGRKDAPPMEV